MDENLRHRCSRVEGAKPRLAERVEAAIALSGPACRATQQFLRTLDALELVELANAGTRITESFPETLIFLDKHDLLDLAEHALAQLAHEGFTTRLLGYHGKSPEEIVWGCLTKHQALGCARLVQEKLYPLKAGVRTGLPAEILCQAALRANEAMLRFLVEEVGVHPDGRESSAPGVSAVQRLLGEGHEKLGLWLASKPGTNLLRADGQGKDTLMYAAKSCGEEAGRFLLDRGLRPAVSDLTGRTALHEAAAGGNLAMARLLLEAGADPNRADSRGLTPLHMAADGMDENNMDMVETLVRYGADIEARDFMGNTPFLEMAASFWSGKKSEADLEQAVNRWRLLGADLAARNWSGRDAVLLAYGMDGQGLLGRVLLSAGLRPPEKLFDGTAAVRTVQRSRTFAQDLAAATRRERARQGLLPSLEDDEPGPLL